MRVRRLWGIAPQAFRLATCQPEDVLDARRLEMAVGGRCGWLTQWLLARRVAGHPSMTGAKLSTPPMTAVQSMKVYLPREAHGSFSNARGR
jgi:hypothetical protein